MGKEKLSNENANLAMKVSANSIIVNLLLSLGKLAAGIFAHSGAMISDAAHSASDVFSTFIVIIGVKFAGKDSDKGHQYGHERFECVASIVLSIALLFTGFGIGYSGLTKIFAGNYSELKIPGATAMVAAVVSIIVKEIMYHYTKKAAKKINSGALLADAWHHRTDALSSIGSFIGIFGARIGFPVLDPVASVVICLFIIKAGIDIFVGAMKQMTDEACDDDTVNKIRELVAGEPGVIQVDLLKTRVFATKIYVDIEIAADGSQTLNESHAIAERVHDHIEQNFPDVKHCMVHVNPYKL